MHFKNYLCATLVLVCASAAVADESDQAKLERDFAESLSGSVLVGTFTVDGIKTDKPNFPERYELKSVEKVSGNFWRFTARMKYMTKDVTLPVTVPIVWAGDTPMISLTDVAIPGLGSEFSARVLFYDGRYAGTWQHGKYAGHMWGKIEKPAKSDSSKETPKTVD